MKRFIYVLVFILMLNICSISYAENNPACIKGSKALIFQATLNDDGALV